MSLRITEAGNSRQFVQGSTFDIRGGGQCTISVLFGHPLATVDRQCSSTARAYSMACCSVIARPSAQASGLPSDSIRSEVFRGITYGNDLSAANRLRII
jgi:hypothetical protein